MNAKEKAQELFDKMMQTISSDCEHDSYCTEKECRYNGTIVCKVKQEEARQCAIICVDEIIDACTQQYQSDLVHYRETGGYEFWQSVKTELRTLLFKDKEEPDDLPYTVGGGFEK